MIGFGKKKAQNFGPHRKSVFTPKLFCKKGKALEYKFVLLFRKGFLDSLRSYSLLSGLAHCLVPLFDEFLAFFHFFYYLVRIDLVLLKFLQFCVVFVVANALVKEFLMGFLLLLQNFGVPLKILGF
jgi:hypothetical protein